MKSSASQRCSYEYPLRLAQKMKSLLSLERDPHGAIKNLGQDVAYQDTREFKQFCDPSAKCRHCDQPHPIT